MGSKIIKTNHEGLFVWSPKVIGLIASCILGPRLWAKSPVRCVAGASIGQKCRRNCGRNICQRSSRWFFEQKMDFDTWRHLGGRSLAYIYIRIICIYMYVIYIAYVNISFMNLQSYTHTEACASAPYSVKDGWNQNKNLLVDRDLCTWEVQCCPTVGSGGPTPLKLNMIKMKPENGTSLEEITVEHDHFLRLHISFQGCIISALPDFAHFLVILPF